LKLALLKENKSRVLEDRVMRRIYGLERDDVKGYRLILNRQKNYLLE
jgi:predicted transcriptional regulator